MLAVKDPQLRDRRASAWVDAAIDVPLPSLLFDVSIVPRLAEFMRAGFVENRGSNRHWACVLKRTQGMQAVCGLEFGACVCCRL